MSAAVSFQPAAPSGPHARRLPASRGCDSERVPPPLIRSRHAYSVHYVEGGAHWAEDNWLQRKGDLPFEPL